MSSRCARMYITPMKELASSSLLAPKHKKFADEYLSCGNASEAARRAGYSKKSAGVQGNKLVKRADVKLYLAEAAEKHSAEQTPLLERWLSETEALAFANIGDYITVDEDGIPQVDFSNATPEQLKAVASIASKSRTYYDKDGNNLGTEKSSRFVMSDKYRGLDMIARHLGLYKETESKVVIDVADRLIEARKRYAAISAD